VWPLAVDVIIAQCDHRLLLTGYRVGAVVSIVDLFCEATKGRQKNKKCKKLCFIIVNMPATQVHILPSMCTDVIKATREHVNTVRHNGIERRIWKVKTN